jgi:hypothetical protein
VNANLYAPIWLALILFAAAEVGKAWLTIDRTSLAWARRAWLAGAALCVMHIAVAMSVRYGWSHQSAVEETARQTAAVYGIDWGGGVYVNYVFVAVWIAEGVWWLRSPVRYAARSGAIRWTLRAFYLVIIANAAVVFASPLGRVFGVGLVGGLLWIWFLEPRSTAHSSELRG